MRGVLLQRIEEDPGRPDLLEESETGERGVYVLMTSGQRAASCRIDPGVQVILDALSEEPHVHRRVELAP